MMFTIFDWLSNMNQIINIQKTLMKSFDRKTQRHVIVRVRIIFCFI